jgi:hypothetical protein
MDTNSNQFSIFVAPIVWISLVVLQLPCWSTEACLQRHSDSVSVLRRTQRWRPATFPLQRWTTIIKLVIKFMNCFEWRRPLRLKIGAKPPLCSHDNSYFNTEQRCFYALFYRRSSLSVILCKLAHEQEQRGTSALEKSKNYSPWSTVGVTMLQNIVHCMVE